jgi:hypothetical protein
MTDQQRELAIQYFEAYPEEHVLHISQDGQVFLHSNHNDAINHQRSLTTEPVTTIRRKDLGAYAPAFDYESMTDEEKAAYDKVAEELTEVERKNEEALKAKIEEEERLKAEQLAKDEEARKAEEQRLADEEAARVEEQRIADEQAAKDEEARKAEEQRLADEEAAKAEEARKAEEQLLADEKAKSKTPAGAKKTK